jgi:hypothetical protein
MSSGLRSSCRCPRVCGCGFVAVIWNLLALEAALLAALMSRIQNHELGMLLSLARKRGVITRVEFMVLDARAVRHVTSGGTESGVRDEPNCRCALGEEVDDRGGELLWGGGLSGGGQAVRGAGDLDEGGGHVGGV